MDRARSWNVKINASVIVSGEWDSIRFTTGRSLDPSVSDSTYYDDWVRGLLSRKTYVDAYTQISRFCSRKEGRKKKGREGRERNKKKKISIDGLKKSSEAQTFTFVSISYPWLVLQFLRATNINFPRSFYIRTNKGWKEERR